MKRTSLRSCERRSGRTTPHTPTFPISALRYHHPSSLDQLTQQPISTDASPISSGNLFQRIRQGKKAADLPSTQALPQIPMPIIELPQHRHPIRPPGHQDHHMHDLMTRPKQIKPPRIPPLRKLSPAPPSQQNPQPHHHQNQLTLAAYAPAPTVFNTNVVTIHRSAIRSD